MIHRHRARFRIALLAAAVLLTYATGHAGPPYVTDDPEPVPYRHRPGLQLHVIGQLTYARPSGGSTFYAVGDTEVGAKFRFIDEGPWYPMVSMYPLFDFPTGDSAHQLGTGHARAFLPLWLQKSLGP